MNCTEYLEQLHIDPSCRDKDFLDHGARCQDCHQETQRVRRFESLLHRALDIPEKDELEAQVRHTYRRKRSQRRRLRTFAGLGLAAGILLMLGSAWILNHVLNLLPQPAPAVATSIIDHIHQEPHQIAVNHYVPAANVRDVMRRLSLGLRQDLEQVRFAGICDIGKHRAVHLILTGQKGPITVLVIPDQNLHWSGSFDSGDLEGQLVSSELGITAVVGNKDEDVGDLVRQLEKTIVHGTRLI